MRLSCNYSLLCTEPGDSTSIFEMTIDRLQLELGGIVSNADYAGQAIALQKMKTFYDSCMDTTTIDARGVEPLLDLINETGILCLCTSSLATIYVTPCGDPICFLHKCKRMADYPHAVIHTPPLVLFPDCIPS